MEQSWDLKILPREEHRVQGVKTVVAAYSEQFLAMGKYGDRQAATYDHYNFSTSDREWALWISKSPLRHSQKDLSDGKS